MRISGLLMEKRVPRWLSAKESACNAGDTGDVGLIPGSGKYPEGGQVGVKLAPIFRKVRP